MVGCGMTARDFYTEQIKDNAVKTKIHFHGNF